MDSFEINKIIAAVLMVVILVIGIDKVSDIIFHVEKPKTPGYAVDIEQVNTTSTETTEEKINITAFMTMGDIATGEKVFKKCKSCHSIKQGGGNKIGPALWNVMFRKVGSIADYKYSKALTSYGKEWSWEEMNGFLIKPSKWIPNNKMGFAGIKSEKDRASIILYLNQNSDNPKPLP
tara:strand:- start:600 stop:1130 length:531 start_codon:yes stop_codon:yes gene_type:complete